MRRLLPFLVPLTACDDVGIVLLDCEDVEVGDSIRIRQSPGVDCTWETGNSIDYGSGELSETSNEGATFTGTAPGQTEVRATCSIKTVEHSAYCTFDVLEPGEPPGPTELLTDGELNAWTDETVYTFGGASAGSEAAAEGGNPGAHRIVSHTMPAADLIDPLREIHTHATHLQTVDPSTLPAAEGNLFFSIDLRRTLTYGPAGAGTPGSETVSLLIAQGTQSYTFPASGTVGDTWQTLATNVSIPGQLPDLSAGTEPIAIGFEIQTRVPNNTAGDFTVAYHVDNYHLEFQRP